MLQPQPKATLDNAIVYSTDELRNRRAFSHNLSDRAVVDGKMHLTTTSTGARIHPTDEGIRNFWRWFNGVQPKRVAGKDGQRKIDRGNHGADNGAAGSWTRDSRGRPQVFYHGTGDDFSTFNLYHQNRKDAGWLGLASTPLNTHLAEKYASLGWVSKSDVTTEANIAKSRV